jgi:phage terminase large subunit-like protein
MGRRKGKKADRSPGWRSRRAIKWFEDYLRIPEGKFVGDKLEVAEFMREDLRAIYDNPAGTRRAIISRGRKNGKTIEAAMIVLLHLCGPEKRRNSQLYSTALSREQAFAGFLALIDFRLLQHGVISGSSQTRA